MGSQKQGVSIVVPTLNRESHLLAAVRDLMAQDHMPIEIFIVDQSDNGSADMRCLASEHPDLVSYHKVQFRGLPLARNYGWQRAKYEAIVFLDDDIRCGPSLVREHLRGLSRPNIAMVAGGIDDRIARKNDGSTPGKFNSWTSMPYRGFNATVECLVTHVPGGNFSAWRSILQAVGGFDEALGIGAALYEETELCLRVKKCGFDIYFNGKARVLHLGAGDGGCRVPDLGKYMGSLAHNRAVLIGRHSRWFQVPTAYLRLFLLFISYAVHYRTLDIFRPGIVGFLQGMKTARQPPLCSGQGIGAHA